MTGRAHQTRFRGQDRRWLFRLISVWLAAVVSAGAPTGFFPLGRLLVAEWRSYLTPGYDPVATFTSLALGPVFRPWTPLEVYYSPLSVLDFLAWPWLVLFMAVTALLPPFLAPMAPLVWGLTVVLLLAGLRAGPPWVPKAVRRRRVFRVSAGVLAVWLALTLVTAALVAVHDARARQEAHRAESERLAMAVDGMSAAMPALAAALEDHRSATGAYPARAGRIDWTVLDRERGASSLFTPEVREFTYDATPGARPLELAPMGGFFLSRVLEAAYDGWPIFPGEDLVYLEYVTPERYRLILIPWSERAREILGDRALVEDELGAGSLPLAHLTPILEETAADHGALALEELGYALHRCFDEYHIRTGGYPPVDTEGNMAWPSLYENSAASPETMEGWAHRTWDLRFVVRLSPPARDPFVPYLYQGRVGYYRAVTESDDVLHTVTVTPGGYSFVFAPLTEPLRAAMARRAGAGSEGPDLLITPAGVSYGRAPGEG